MTKTEWDAADFAEFFTALWGKPPFAWQRDLARRVLERGVAPADSPDAKHGGPWPEAIALPTASGKTACMDIAVFALASQAFRLESGRPVTAPRRIFFVVDRRVIVDEAYERARCLAKKLDEAQTSILKSAADNLRRIARGESAGFAGERPLSVHVLRGGMYRSEAWARSPLQPTITASTVDQIGSRLLFRAYGRGSGVWPVYAGLAANDSLILLDEAHCAQPFLQTLQAVRRFRNWAQSPPSRCFHSVVMSATPPPGLQDVFKDRSDEGRDPGSPLGRRRLARKPAILREIGKAKGNRAADVLAESLAEAAVDLLDEQRRAVAVFVNRVAAARKTWRLLRGREDIDAVLLTGRMRPIDKDEVVDRQLKPLRSNLSEKRALSKPLVVVATQTLEVGADLDFDGLVTECASLDALRQRFGRLNRMGRPIEARTAILIRGDQTGEKADDPIYGKALAKTWNWLNECKDNNGEVDFGIAHLDRLLSQREDLDDFNMPARNAPVMLPAHVDCWAQTSPQPSPSPDVAPFLHGEGEGAPDVQVCWRADLDLANEPGATLDILRLCPPSSSETLPAPVGVFRRWLAGEDVEDDSGDVEGAATDNAADSRTSPAAEQRLIVRWRGADTDPEKDIMAKPADIRPGDVIVIPNGHPGPWERLGDLPPEAAEPVEALDAGDRAYRLARAKPILRLHPKLIDAWPDSAPREAAGELLRGLGSKYEEDPDEAAEAVRGLLQELAEPAAPFPDRWSWLSQAAGELAKEFAERNRPNPNLHILGKEENESLILVGRRRIAELAGEADSFSDEDDAAASGITRPVRLDDHLCGVEEFARRYALGCGLPHDLAEAVACAGLLHDAGKADPRFQSLLQGGARWLGREPLAKSAAMPKTRSAYDRARKAAGYPQGGRHELLSLRLAESAELLPENDDLRDLTLHLIAAHHGRCRPFAPVICDGGSETEFALPGGRMCWSGPTGLERLDSGAAERYWRLTRRYGWWGLAWLEALLRLADWRRSEREETHDGGA